MITWMLVGLQYKSSCCVKPTTNPVNETLLYEHCKQYYCDNVAAIIIISLIASCTQIFFDFGKNEESTKYTACNALAQIY